MKFKFNLKSDAEKIQKHLDQCENKALKKQMIKTVMGGDNKSLDPSDDLGWSNDWSNLAWVNNWSNNWRNLG
ncbi:hypothetical protein [uncultured Chryseobacterium sp.]|uniref:hypothetical protein n=1 Tax=uncultured Chryseobacterium sp. TaxID=259322 RepID=UPI0025DCF57A|nr:hypothetical protein [uncultured Chryseobacterium sp.]